MEDDFLDLLKQTCKIERWDGQDVYGQPRYKPAVTIHCRTSYKTRMARNSQGQEVVSSAKTWLPPFQVTIKDRITLPDGSQPLILQVGSQPDENEKIHHQVVYT